MEKKASVNATNYPVHQMKLYSVTVMTEVVTAKARKVKARKEAKRVKERRVKAKKVEEMLI